MVNIEFKIKCPICNYKEITERYTCQFCINYTNMRTCDLKVKGE